MMAPLWDQGNDETQAEGWAELWQTTHQYTQPAFRITSEFFTDLMPMAILDAAMSFPADTGLGHNNASPRAFARLSWDALAALTALFLAFERYGDWADVLNLVLIVLLPKGDGAYRPIGLFPTPIRIWFKSRLDITKRWDHMTAMPSVFGGPGMGAQKAA